MMNFKRLFLIVLPIIFVQESRSMFFSKIFGNNVHTFLKPLVLGRSKHIHKMEIKNTPKQDPYELQPWTKPGIKANTKKSYCENLLTIIGLSFTLKNNKEIDEQFRNKIKNDYHAVIDEFQKINCLDNYINYFPKGYKNAPYAKKSDAQKEAEVLSVLNEQYEQKNINNLQ